MHFNFGGNNQAGDICVLDLYLENIDKKLPSGVYAVAVNGTIRYCGETIRPLRERFRNYINADKTQRTNIRLRNHWIYHQSIR